MTDGSTSKQAAIDHFRLIIDATNTDSRYNMGFVDGLEFCINHLSTMPSVQPEIIRCKDCKWKQGSECVRFAEVRPFPDDFCSRAERREE